MKNDLITMSNLVLRNAKIFFKDKAAVFFSLLSPLIVLLLYILFLGDMQLNSLTEAFAGSGISEKNLKALIDSWMLAGVMSVACITVSFSAFNSMIRDRESGVLADAMASPIKRWVVTGGYFVYNAMVTFIICLIVLVIAFIYLAIIGWYLSAGDVFALFGTMIISILSSALVGSVICTFLKSTNAHGAFVGILSAAIGFLCGAFMPLSMFPKAVQYIVLLVPGTYSAGMFRNLFMSGALNEIAVIAPQAADAIRTDYSMELDFLGAKIGVGVMAGILAATIIIFAAINVVITYLKKKKGPLNIGTGKRRKSENN